jgi:hypothetical protein
MKIFKNQSFSYLKSNNFATLVWTSVGPINQFGQLESIGSSSN